MNKFILLYFMVALMASLTSYGSAISDEFPYAMAQCHLSVLKLDRLDKTYNMNGLKFKEVRYNGNEILMMKPRWTGVDVHLSPFMKVFTYRYANADGVDIDVTVESYCKPVPKDHLLKLFKRQNFTSSPGPVPGCYILEMKDSGSYFARFRYGVMCLSKSHVMFIHTTPKENEEVSDEKGASADAEKEAKEKILEDLKQLVHFYMPQLADYIPKKFTMDLTG